MNSSKQGWFRYLPVTIRNKIEHRPNLLKVLNNVSWLFADRILRMVAGLLITVWLARYLGTEKFGLLNYATAFVALFGALATMGLNGIVVRDLVKEPETANTVLGTAFVLQFLGGIIAFSLAVLTINILRPDNELLRLMVIIFSFALLFRGSEVVKYWFESQVQSKYVVWVENCIFLVFVLIKVILIILHANLVTFAWAALAEGIVTASAMLGVYIWRGNSLLNWRAKYLQAKKLIIDSWPLILSSLAIMAYMRIDQIMIGQMLGDEAVGVYSAAVRICEVWYFVPVGIVASVFPSIIEAKKHSEKLYDLRLQKLYDLMVVISLLVAVPMTFLSEWFVVMAFGKEYKEAGLLLSINIWAGIFVSLGTASGKWFLVENLSSLMFYRTLWGALINIALNFLLIPRYGVLGAVIATFVSYSVAGFWFDLFNLNTRELFFMKVRAIFLRGFYAK